MKNEQIFTKIMELIEKETDMPMFEKDVENWLAKNKENEKIYELYKQASMSRNL